MLLQRDYVVDKINGLYRAQYYSTTTPPMHRTCFLLHILPIDLLITLMVLNLVWPIYIGSWMVVCGMQFLFVRYTWRVRITALAEDET